MTFDSQRKRSSIVKEDYYDILGVSRTATDEEIKQAYRKLALQLHPDKNSDPEATVRFQAINQAHKILGNPKLRSAYDLLGSQAAEMIDHYQEYPGTFSEMSICRKFLFGLVFCLTGCCFGFGCCCLCCGCLCCCNFCCNRCCGKCKTSSASVQSEEEQTDSIHRQPTNTDIDSTRY